MNKVGDRDDYDLPDIGVLYDGVTRNASRPDVAFYVNECTAIGGETLELGCGTGRVLIPVARAGLTITGLDRSSRMLARCHENLRREPPDVRNRVRIVEGDMRNFDLGRRFDCIISPFRSIQHLLDVNDQRACLSAAARHLEPRGRLILDVFNPDPRIFTASPTAETPNETPPAVTTDSPSYRLTGRVTGVHLTEQSSDVELTYHLTMPDGRSERTVQRFLLRWFTRSELEHLLARAGFTLCAVFGSFDRLPFGDDSREIIIVAELAA